MLGQTRRHGASRAIALGDTEVVGIEPRCVSPQTIEAVVRAALLGEHMDDEIAYVCSKRRVGH